jgi:hypothetical protein
MKIAKGILFLFFIVFVFLPTGIYKLYIGGGILVFLYVWLLLNLNLKLRKYLRSKFEEARERGE